MIFLLSYAVLDTWMVFVIRLSQKVSSMRVLGLIIRTVTMRLEENRQKP